MFSSLLPRERSTLETGKITEADISFHHYSSRIHFNIITKDGIEERRLPLRRD